MPPVLLIKSTQPAGHFRAGRYHGPAEKAWETAYFTAAELVALRADPRLVVQEGEIDAPEQLKLVPKLAATPTQVCPVSDLRVIPPLPEVDGASTATAVVPEGTPPPAPAQGEATKPKAAKAKRAKA